LPHKNTPDRKSPSPNRASAPGGEALPKGGKGSTPRQSQFVPTLPLLSSFVSLSLRGFSTLSPSLSLLSRGSLDILPKGTSKSPHPHRSSAGGSENLPKGTTPRTPPPIQGSDSHKPSLYKTPDQKSPSPRRHPDTILGGSDNTHNNTSSTYNTNNSHPRVSRIEQQSMPTLPTSSSPPLLPPPGREPSQSFSSPHPPLTSSSLPSGRSPGLQKKKKEKEKKEKKEKKGGKEKVKD